MHKLFTKLRLGISVPVLAAALALVPVTVYAQHGADDGTSDQSSQESGSGRSTTSDSRHSEIKTVAETESNDASGTHEAGDDNGSDEAKASAAVLKSRAAKLLDDKRQNGKLHSAEQKHKSCEARAANINKRADKYAQHAQKHLSVFNKIFTRVQNFKTEKQLNVDNYDALLAATTAKQQAAQTAVDALKALDVSIDCSQADPAVTVAKLKEATANARTALHEYRKSVKDFAVAVKAAAAPADDAADATEGGTQ